MAGTNALLQCQGATNASNALLMIVAASSGSGGTQNSGPVGLQQFAIVQGTTDASNNLLVKIVS